MMDLNEYKPLKGVKGYVYLLKSVYDPTTIKIGCTHNPRKRLQTLRRKIPFTVEYLHVFRVDNMRRVEGDLHRGFKTQRLQEEWYYLNEQHVKRIVRSLSLLGGE